VNAGKQHLCIHDCQQLDNQSTKFLKRKQVQKQPDTSTETLSPHHPALDSTSTLDHTRSNDPIMAEPSTREFNLVDRTRSTTPTPSNSSTMSSPKSGLKLYLRKDAQGVWRFIDPRTLQDNVSNVQPVRNFTAVS
jgi:hypothetical protein